MVWTLMLLAAWAAEPTPTPTAAPVEAAPTPAVAPPTPAVAAPVATATTWPAWRGDATQRGRAPGALGKLAQQWTWSAGEAIVSSAVVDDTHVYVGVKDGRVVALDRTTGALSWQVETGGPVEAPPLRVGDLLVVGSRDRKVRALVAKDGSERWVFDAEAEVVGAPAFVGGPSPSLLIGAYDGRLHRLDLATGKPQWAYETGSYIYGSPAIRGGQALIGGCDGFVHTVDLAAGTSKARTVVEAYVGASPTWPADDAAYVGHFGNRVIAFDPTKGEVGWTYFDRSFPYLSSPAVTDDLVILGARDKIVRALERKTGELWWLVPTKGKVDGAPVIVGDKVVFGSADGRLYVVTLADGDEVQTIDLGEPITASVAVASGSVYVGTEGGTFVALGPPAK
jgi:outer membrane protein assembly factor BamB